MAKIRGVKPDLWTDEDFVELSPFARLLWVGMWNYACDNGHLADKSKQIKMRVLPTDDVNCAELLREIESIGLIRRENGVVTIPNFARHQKPDKRYFQTCSLVADCAKPGDSQPETRGGHGETTTGARGGHGVGSWGPLGDGDGEVMVNGSDGDKPPASGRKSQLPSDWQPNDWHTTFAAENRLDLNLQVEKFRDHATATARKMVDWDATFRTWLRNAVEWRREPPTPPGRPKLLPPMAHELELPPDGLNPAEYAAWEADQRRKRARA